MFGKLRQRAIDARLERIALGLPPARRPRKLGPRKKGSHEPPAGGFSSCQHCGALRLPGPNGKLPPHRCEEAS